jgi:hypothetical protein
VLNKSLGPPLVGGGGFMVWVMFIMSKMTRSCYDIVMWVNVYPFCLYSIATSRVANSAYIMIILSIDSALTI